MAIAWGDASSGGHCPEQLNGVQSIQSSARAFAAILVDGSVVAWGYLIETALLWGCGSGLGLRSKILGDMNQPQ